MLPQKARLDNLSYYSQVLDNEDAKRQLKMQYAIFDSKAFEYELQNALRNNLTLDQYQRLFSFYESYSNLVGIPVKQYNYTSWHHLLNLILR